MNLHEVWDEIIILESYRQAFGGQKNPEPVHAGAVYADIVKAPDASDFKLYTKDLSPETWAMERRDYLSEIYSGYQNLDTYIPRQRDIVNTRIRQAATRLAFILNDIFDSKRTIKSFFSRNKISNNSEKAFRQKVSALLGEMNLSIDKIIELKPRTGVVDIPAPARKRPRDLSKSVH
ncbi:MAG: Nuclease [Bacteriovoracaceae bacterium]|nr:Nuclease [Bacteriovoracaceae bacterium]